MSSDNQTIPPNNGQEKADLSPTDSGWIVISKKLLKWQWFHKPNMVQLWIYFLLRANWHQSKWEGLTIERGQVVTGLKRIRKDTGLSIQSIRTCIERLKSTGEITIKSTNKYSIITIRNYNQYQDKPGAQQHADQHADQQTNNKRTTTSNNNNNKNTNTKAAPPPFFEESFPYPSPDSLLLLTALDLQKLRAEVPEVELSFICGQISIWAEKSINRKYFGRWKGEEVNKILEWRTRAMQYGKVFFTDPKEGPGFYFESYVERVLKIQQEARQHGN